MKALVSYCDCSAKKKNEMADAYTLTYRQMSKNKTKKKYTQQWTRQAHKTTQDEARKMPKEEITFVCVKLDDDDSILNAFCRYK